MTTMTMTTNDIATVVCEIVDVLTGSKIEPTFEDTATRMASGFA